MIDIDQTLRMFSSKVDTFVKSSKSCDTVNIIEKALLVRDEFNKLNEWKFKFNKDQKLLFDNIHDRFGDSVLSFEIECECKKKVSSVTKKGKILYDQSLAYFKELGYP